MSDEENSQPIPEPEASPEYPISEPNSIPESSQEPIPDAPIPPVDSISLEVPPEPLQASPSPDSAIMDKDQNPAPPSPEATAGQGNEPLTPASEPLEQPNITTEKHGNDVTITEVMEPTPEPKPETAQMAGNEPLPVSTPNFDEAKEKQRKENLKLANEKRQSKKREKINEILNLFVDKKEITNDEVEKLLHVSDATATRYLETLEKEGKIKQVGKTGKGVVYEKIK